MTGYGFVNLHSISWKGRKVNLCNFSRCSLEILSGKNYIPMMTGLARGKNSAKMVDITKKCLLRKTSAAESAAWFEVRLKLTCTWWPSKSSKVLQVASTSAVLNHSNLWPWGENPIPFTFFCSILHRDTSSCIWKCPRPSLGLKCWQPQNKVSHWQNQNRHKNAATVQIINTSS